MRVDARRRSHQWVMLAGWVLVCEAVGGVSGWLTAPEIRVWYPTLAKPAFTPPDWVFGPVWTILFALMGAAAWLIWRASRSVLQRQALQCFWAQLMVNFVWTMVFFRRHAILEAGVVILFLFVLIAASVYLFRRISKAAAWLMVPYLAWVGFAAALNWTIWRLNK